MVVGNGLLANVFSSFKEGENILIFASGVSNSRCTEKNEFDRELNLVKTYDKTEKLFIYFSTSSIEDPFLKESDYINHKLAIESFIQNHFSKFLIVRLPNVVGVTKNQHTLMNFIYNSIINKSKINIQENATRYLIDIDDVYNYLQGLIINENELNTILNLVVAEKISVQCVVECFERHLHQKVAKEILKSQGGNYSLQLSPVFAKYGLKTLKDGELYLKKLVEKYYSK